MSTGQTASPTTVEEEVIYYLTGITVEATMGRVIDWVKEQKPDLTREAIEEIVKDLMDRGKLKTVTYLRVVRPSAVQEGT